MRCVTVQLKPIRANIVAVALLAPIGSCAKQKQLTNMAGTARTNLCIKQKFQTYQFAIQIRALHQTLLTEIRVQLSSLAKVVQAMC